MTHLLIILAQSELAPTSWSNLLQNLGSAAVAAAILGWQLSLRVKELQEARKELRETNEKLLELAERAIPVLGEATRTLTDVTKRTDDLFVSDELRSELRRLERQLGELRGDR